MIPPWTTLDQMANHASRVRRYMDLYGEDEVESFIDRCLSIEDLIDPYLPFQERKIEAEEAKPTKATLDIGKFQAPGGRNYLDNFMNPKEVMEKQRKEAEAAKNGAGT